MSTASCPCCGSKEPVPGGNTGRRLICSNCGTPFVPGAQTTAPPEPEPEATPAAEVVEAVEAVPAVEVEPVEPAPRPKKPKPADPPRRRRREPETSDEMETLPEVPRHDEGDDGPFVPPPQPARRRKKSGGAGALVLGAVAFVAVLCCGGLGIGGYLFYHAHFEPAVAEGTGKEGGTEKQPPAKEVEYVDAAKGARAGDVRVSVVSAVVDVITGTDGGGEFRSADKLLALKVRVENLSDGRKVEYSGWGADGGDEQPRLTDEQGRAYKLVTFAGDRRVAGQVRSESLGPKKSLEDLIIFDPPAGDAQALKLELPARNVGAPGKLGLRLPRSAVRFGALPTPDDRSRTVPQLMQALKDTDPKMRVAAADALGARGSAAALAADRLAENLKDFEPEVRLSAARALGKVGPTAHAAYPALVRALGDADPAVRKAARESLDKLGRPVPKDIAALKDSLKDSNKDVRAFALETLLGLELDVKTAAPLYAALLKDDDKALRLEAAKALGKVGPKGREAAFAALMEAQRDADPDVRKAAGEALTAMGPGAAGDVPALRAALKQRAAPVELRARAAEALGALGPGARDAVPDLAEALRAQDVPLRRAAAAALAKVGPDAKGAIVDLKEALGDKDRQVRRSALDAIGKMGAGGKPASGEVADLLTDPDADTRKAAGRVLVLIDADAALAAYSRALFNPDDAVRLEAADVLLAMGPAAKPRAADLIAALGDKSPAVRLKVARALTAIDPTSSAPVRPLAELLSGTDAAMRRDAAEALAAVGAVARDAVPALNGALKDKDMAVRKNAAVALSKVGDAAVPALASLIDALAERRLHESVLPALKNIGWVKAVPPLVKALKSNDPLVRLGAAQALGQFGDDAIEALRPLNTALAAEKDEDAKKAMREALKKIKPE